MPQASEGTEGHGDREEGILEACYGISVGQRP